MLGPERFDHYLHTFGFGQQTALGFPGEANYLLLPLDNYNDTSMGSMPIGNGIAVSAIQMLDVYTTIANGGMARAPRLVEATVDRNGERHDVPLLPPHRVISPSTASAVSGMLELVVQGGTGISAAVTGYRVAGKTGTARKPPYEHPPYRYVASFVGFAPANAPRLAAIVVLDEPSNAILRRHGRGAGVLPDHAAGAGRRARPAGPMSRSAIVGRPPHRRGAGPARLSGRGSGARECDRYPDERRMVGEPRGRARVRWHELLAGLDVVERVRRRRRRSHLHHRRQPPRAGPATCFACRSGARFDGHDHAAQAVADGAVALLVERTLPLAVPQARVASVPRALGPAAARLYGDPSRAMRCLGITGTAGKSTTAALLEGIARAAGETTGLIGNDGVFVDGVALAVEKWGGTNMPQADQLQYLLAQMRDDGVRTVAMEVTSRALDFGRVDATWFAAACFTNLSHEHLDDHGSLEAYFQAKLELFDPARVATVATNVDDPYGARVRDHANRLGLDVWTYAVDEAHADIGATEVVLGDHGTALTDRRPPFGCRSARRVAAHRRVQRREPARRRRHGTRRRPRRSTR